MHGHIWFIQNQIKQQDFNKILDFLNFSCAQLLNLWIRLSGDFIQEHFCHQWSFGINVYPLSWLIKQYIVFTFQNIFVIFLYKIGCNSYSSKMTKLKSSVNVIFSTLINWLSTMRWLCIKNRYKIGRPHYYMEIQEIVMTKNSYLVVPYFYLKQLGKVAV